MKERKDIADNTLHYAARTMDRAHCLQIARLLDALGVCEIVADIRSGEELEAYRSHIKNAALSICAGMEPERIASAIRFGARSIHLEIPASYPRIYAVFGKNKDWVKKTLSDCLDLLVKADVSVSVGLVDASRAQISFLESLASQFSGVRVTAFCVKDTLGVQPLSACADLIRAARGFGYPVGYEAHDQLGMAVANTLQALKTGAARAYCALGGVGYACSLTNLLKTARLLFSFDIDRKEAEALDQLFGQLRKL